MQLPEKMQNAVQLQKHRFVVENDKRIVEKHHHAHPGKRPYTKTIPNSFAGALHTAIEFHREQSEGIHAHHPDHFAFHMQSPKRTKNI